MSRFVKGTCTVVFILLVLPGAVRADGLPGWFGFKGGVSMAWLGGEDSGADWGFAPGVAVGAFVSKMIYPKVVLEFDGLFIQKGGRDTGYAVFGESLDSGQQTTRISMVEFPVLVRITDRLWGQLGASLILGASLAFVTSGTRTTDFKLQGEVESDIDRLISFDFGLLAGVSVEWGPVFVEGLYDWGVRFIDSTSETDINELRAHTVAIMAGLRLEL